MIKSNSNFIIITTTVILSISIIFSLAIITTIELTYANHTKYHLNNSLVDVTISGDDIPDALLEDIKRNIAMKAEKKASENNNNSQLQTKKIEDTTKAKIILTSQNFKKGDSPQIVGQVKNVGNGTAKDIRIAYSYYDQNNDILGSEIIYLDISKLMEDPTIETPLTFADFFAYIPYIKCSSHGQKMDRWNEIKFKYYNYNHRDGKRRGNYEI